MRFGLYGVSLVSWGLAIWLFMDAQQGHHALQLLPIIDYNRPQGIFGWAVTIAVVCTFISIGAHNQRVYQLRARHHSNS